MAKSEWFTLFSVVFLVIALLILAITIPNHTQELRMMEDAINAKSVYTPRWVGARSAILYASSGSLILLSSIFIVIAIKSK